MACLKLRKLKTKNVYCIQYSDEHGKTRVVKGSTHKQIALQMMAKIVLEVEKRKVGMTDDFMLHAARPISDHLEEFKQDLISRDVSKNHVIDTTSCCERIIHECNFQRITDLNESAVKVHLKKLRDKGLSTSSTNRHTRAIKSFARWLWESKKTVAHQLIALKLLNAEIDRRHVRRALTDHDFARLLQATQNSPRIDKGRDWRFDGQDRYMLYLVAAMTGLRASELASVTVGSFCPLAKTITVEASNTKNKEIAILPVHPEVAFSLSEYCIGRSLKDKILPGSWAAKKRSATILRRDLAAAKIPYVRATAPQ